LDGSKARRVMQVCALLKLNTKAVHQKMCAFWSQVSLLEKRKHLHQGIVFICSSLLYFYSKRNLIRFKNASIWNQLKESLIVIKTISQSK
jgi:hypothetical protein